MPTAREKGLVFEFIGDNKVDQIGKCLKFSGNLRLTKKPNDFNVNTLKLNVEQTRIRLNRVLLLDNLIELSNDPCPLLNIGQVGSVGGFASSKEGAIGTFTFNVCAPENGENHTSFIQRINNLISENINYILVFQD